jgi:hypothetical protein
MSEQRTSAIASKHTRLLYKTTVHSMMYNAKHYKLLVSARVSKYRRQLL